MRRKFLRYFALFLICWLGSIAHAVDMAMLDAGKVTGKTFRLEGVKLAIGDLDKKQSQVVLSANKLAFAKPFHDLSLADIRCDKLTWQQENIDCRQGRAAVRSAYWQSPSTDFAFHLSPNRSAFRLANARFGASQLSLNAELKGNDWQITVEAKQVDKRLLSKLLLEISVEATLPQIKQGHIDLTATISGKDDKVLAFQLTAQADGITGQTADGKLAAEQANLHLHLQAITKNGLWSWRGESQVLGGALYVDPVFLEITSQPLVLTARGTTNRTTKLTNIQSFSFLHPDVVRLTGNAVSFYPDKVQIDKADVNLQSDALQSILTTYINPFFTESPFANMTVSGNLNARFGLVQQAFTEAAINFTELDVDDRSGSIKVKGGAGEMNWSSDPTEKKQSKLAWQALSLKGLPFDSATLSFNSQGNAFQLSKKAKLPMLNGSLTVDKFSWQAKPNNEPDVSFTGSLDHLSLEQLSKARGWTPLSGDISGQIPGVEYHNKTLSLGGELLIKVFGGTVKISHLTSSGWFRGIPKLASDIEIEQLDLEQLTSKFEFGTITGRLSGFVKNLVLENWHPVSFYAWFGTPDDDDSSHRISQKAVKNIASIGGGGATDLLSRSFLSFFETFRYDQIGMGCYLHEGVCQLMGLEAAGQGYYLIKGGFPPRIDVLGYNPRVNWDVLVERLKRVAEPEQAIIQ